MGLISWKLVRLFLTTSLSLRLFRPGISIRRHLFIPPLLVVWRHFLSSLHRRRYRPSGTRFEKTRPCMQALPKRFHLWHLSGEPRLTPYEASVILHCRERLKCLIEPRVVAFKGVFNLYTLNTDTIFVGIPVTGLTSLLLISSFSINYWKSR